MSTVSTVLVERATGDGEDTGARGSTESKGMGEGGDYASGNIAERGRCAVADYDDEETASPVHRLLVPVRRA